MYFILTILYAFFCFSQANEIEVNKTLIQGDLQSCLHHFKYGNKHYFINRETQSFYDAIEFCENHNMELLSIEDAPTNEAIQIALNSLVGKVKSNFWTAGTRIFTGKWQWWLNTAVEIKFFDWAPGQPSENGGPEGDCLSLSVNYYENSGYWEADDCESFREVICQIV